MSDDRPWPGTTRDDDLRVSGSDVDGEPTAPMAAVGEEPPAVPGRHSAPPRVARPAAALPDDDEVPFWLLPPPAPATSQPVPQPAPLPEPGPQPVTPQPVPPVVAAPPLVPGLQPAPLPAAADVHQPTVPVPGVPLHPSPAAPGGRAGRTRRPDVVGTPSGPGVLDRGAAALDRALAAAAPLARRVRALPPAWLAAGAAALAVVVVLVVVVGSLGGGEEGSTASADTPATPTPSAVPVAASRISASASSTQEKAGRTTYEASNTLDGKPATAWNSHGDVDGPGPGITLTYTFDEPVALRSIRLANGYQKSIRSDGRNLDLYDANSRLREVRVVTDGGEWTWELADKKAPQVLREDFGTTSSVTIEIVSVWPGSKFSDVGVSEVAFTAVREG